MIEPYEHFTLHSSELFFFPFLVCAKPKMEVQNKYVTIKANVNGAPEESDFEIKVENVSLIVESGSKDVVVKNLFVSIDPYHINRMKSQSSSQQAISFATAITPGEAIDTYGVGRVLVSHRPEFKKDDLVAGLLTWGEYTIVKEGSMLISRIVIWTFLCLTKSEFLDSVDLLPMLDSLKCVSRSQGREFSCLLLQVR